jgi:hypothetical protein
MNMGINLIQTFLGATRLCDRMDHNPLFYRLNLRNSDRIRRLVSL